MYQISFLRISTIFLKLLTTKIRKWLLQIQQKYFNILMAKINAEAEIKIITNNRRVKPKSLK